MAGEEIEIMEEKKENGNKKDTKENVFQRVKERLSMRSKKKKSEIKESQHKTIVGNEQKKEKEIIIEERNDSKQETGKKILEKNNKENNIFQRLIKRLSFRSKKKGGKADAIHNHDLDDEESNEDDEFIEEKKDTKSLSETSIIEDTEISGLCETPSSIPVISSSSRPPLPTMRRPPSSATTIQSRPVSQLDAALKQFKLSTAASRENLRSSRVDISQVEEQVKIMVTSRPSTPTPAGWRSRAPPENSNLVDQWNKLSASLTDLR